MSPWIPFKKHGLLLALILCVPLLSACGNSPTSVSDSANPAPEAQTPGPQAEKLAAMRAKFKQDIPEAAMATMKAATAELEQSGIVAHALNVGDSAPDFTLPNAAGDPVALASLLKKGPVVVVFYRGHWCPYCNVNLTMMQAEALPAIETMDGTLVAISPELPDNSLTMQEKNHLGFDILSDQGSQIAEQFGIVYTLSKELQPLYRDYGIDLPKLNGDNTHRLPLAATYIIDTHGTIAYAYLNTDYSQRAEPRDVVQALKDLKA